MSLYLPLRCHVEEEEDKKAGRDQNERITHILFGLMEVFVEHNLLFSPLMLRLVRLEHYYISSLVQCWKTGHFAHEVTALWKSSSWHSCDRLKWREGGEAKSCLHPFSHFPCFPFLIFCFHSIIIITSFCHKYYWPQQSESQSGREETLDRLSRLWAQNSDCSISEINWRAISRVAKVTNFCHRSLLHKYTHSQTHLRTHSHFHYCSWGQVHVVGRCRPHGRRQNVWTRIC